LGDLSSPEKKNLREDLLGGKKEERNVRLGGSGKTRKRITRQLSSPQLNWGNESHLGQEIVQTRTLKG